MLGHRCENVCSISCGGVFFNWSNSLAQYISNCIVATKPEWERRVRAWNHQNARRLNQVLT